MSDDRTWICGEVVRSQRLGSAKPQRLFQNFKRELVAEFRSPPVQIDDTIYSADFGKSRVKLDKPFEAIAQGALTVGQFDVVEDRLRHSYSIRLWDNFMKSHYYFTLFERGTRYPCDRPEPLILQVANSSQTEIRLDIGELADTAEIKLAYDAQGRMTSSKIQKHSDFRSLVSSYRVSSSKIFLTCKLNPAAEMGIDRLEIKLGVNA